MRHLVLSVISILFFGTAAAAAPLTATPPPPSITILTGEHVTRLLVPLARAYARERHVAITSAQTGSTSEEQISQGLEAHLLLTADKELLNRLSNRGLADVNASKAFAQTKLALVTTHNSAARMELATHISFAATIAAAPDLPIYLEPAADVAGSRSAALLTGYEFSPTLTARAETAFSHRELLMKLRNNGGLALMLMSDAANEPDIIVLSTVPETLAPPIPLYAIVLASESMDQARAFVQYLFTPATQRRLQESGLQPVTN